jgi:hypothetical protein
MYVSFLCLVSNLRTFLGKVFLSLDKGLDYFLDNVVVPVALVYCVYAVWSIVIAVFWFTFSTLLTH